MRVLVRRFIGDLYLNNRLFIFPSVCILLFFCAFFIQPLFRPAVALTAIAFALTLIDYLLLFSGSGRVTGSRQTANRFNIGQYNPITIVLHNSYFFRLGVYVTDELPEQLQERKFLLRGSIAANGGAEMLYDILPLSRGEYHFGRVLCYVSSPLGLLQRRIVIADAQMVKVYPAYNKLNGQERLAGVPGRNTHTGERKLRKLGHSLEFEKIKEYVPGDDVRTINWKATARTAGLMVNTYADARQQQIYCLIDKGRNMKLPFDGLTLLDHSINACLALIHAVQQKQDKAGIITFSDKPGDIVPADRRNDQMHRIIETLYAQQTDFKESDYEAVWALIRRKITQRSLFVLFTNFETMSSVERQLPFLRQMARNHLVCVVFFENTLLKTLHEATADDIEGIYIKTIAGQFAFEKRQIVIELRRHGILALLTTPARLNTDVINKYLELKANRMV
jgi:uncharacterized protein (DUF58 family)